VAGAGGRKVGSQDKRYKDIKVQRYKGRKGKWQWQVAGKSAVLSRQSG